MSTIERKSVVVYKKRIARTEKIIIYKNKTIKKYLNYKKNCKITFQITRENFSNEKFKIVFAMQFLKKKSKKFDINSKTAMNIIIIFSKYI